MIDTKRPMSDWGDVDAEDYYRFIGYIESSVQGDTDESMTAEDVARLSAYAYWLGYRRGVAISVQLPEEPEEWWEEWTPDDYDC